MARAGYPQTSQPHQGGETRRERLAQNSPGRSCLVGKGLTPWSSSKASWQHSQYPFFLLGMVRATDCGLGSRSLGSLGRARGGTKWSLLGLS